MFVCSAEPDGAATISFSDSNSQAANYTGPTIYSNGSNSNSASFSGGQVNWSATLPAGTNAGFSLLRPSFAYDPVVDGAVVSIAGWVNMSVSSNISNTAPFWRLFLVQGGELYRALIGGPVASGFSTVGYERANGDELCAHRSGWGGDYGESGPKAGLQLRHAVQHGAWHHTFGFVLQPQH